MISILELYDLIFSRYLNCYGTYIDLLHDSDSITLRNTLRYRMDIYYEILEIIYNSINE